MWFWPVFWPDISTYLCNNKAHPLRSSMLMCLHSTTCCAGFPSNSSYGSLIPSLTWQAASHFCLVSTCGWHASNLWDVTILRWGWSSHAISGAHLSCCCLFAHWAKPVHYAHPWSLSHLVVSIYKCCKGGSPSFIDPELASCCTLSQYDTQGCACRSSTSCILWVSLVSLSLDISTTMVSSITPFQVVL